MVKVKVYEEGSNTGFRLVGTRTVYIDKAGNEVVKVGGKNRRFDWQTTRTVTI